MAPKKSNPTSLGSVEPCPQVSPISPEIIVTEELLAREDCQRGAYAPWHDEVVRLAVEGRNYGEISKTLGRSAWEVNAVVKSGWFSQRLGQLRAEINFDMIGRMRELWNLTPLAIQVQEQIMESFLAGRPAPNGETVTVREVTSLAKAILDRVGLRAPEKFVIDQTVETTHKRELSYEERLDLLKKYQEAGVPIPADLSRVDLTVPEGRA